MVFASFPFIQTTFPFSFFIFTCGSVVFIIVLFSTFSRAIFFVKIESLLSFPFSFLERILTSTFRLVYFDSVFNFIPKSLFIITDAIKLVEVSLSILPFRKSDKIFLIFV